MHFHFIAILMVALISGCSTTPNFGLFSSKAIGCPIHYVSEIKLNEDFASWQASTNKDKYHCSGTRMHYDPRELYSVKRLTTNHHAVK